MDNAIRNAGSGGLQSAESNTIVDLRDALRERLAIIHDEESRRDEVNTHRSIARDLGKDRQSCKRRYRSRSILDWRIISSAAATTKRWNSWKIRSGAHRGERRSVLVPASANLEAE